MLLVCPVRVRWRFFSCGIRRGTRVLGVLGLHPGRDRSGILVRLASAPVGDEEVGAARPTHHQARAETDAHTSREPDRAMTNGTNESVAKRAGPWRDVVAVVLTVGMAFGAVYLIGDFLFHGYPKPKPQRAFDGASWNLPKGVDCERYDDRGRMIDSLLRDH